MASITFHDVLHGFWAGRGVGTAALEAKLLHQRTVISYLVIFEVLLDLQKAYYNLDKDRCLKIIMAYRVGPRALQIIWTYWGRITMLSRGGRYYGLLFKG